MCMTSLLGRSGNPVMHVTRFPDRRRNQVIFGVSNVQKLNVFAHGFREPSNVHAGFPGRPRKEVMRMTPLPCPPLGLVAPVLAVWGLASNGPVHSLVAPRPLCPAAPSKQLST